MKILKNIITGSQNERNEILKILDKLIDQNDGIEIWSATAKAARFEIQNRSQKKNYN